MNVRCCVLAMSVLMTACAERRGVEPSRGSSGGAPAAVAAFDVDDTVLFSDPGVSWGRIQFGDHALRSPADPRLSVREREEAARFWTRMNSELDAYSVPIDSARRLIAAHRERGDEVVFITGRPDVNDGRNGVAARLREAFGIEEPRVVFVGGAEKAAAIREAGASVYYGDGASDMAAARAAGAMGVAVRRPRYSWNTGPAAERGPAEVVLVDSGE